MEKDEKIGTNMFEFNGSSAMLNADAEKKVLEYIESKKKSIETESQSKIKEFEDKVAKYLDLFYSEGKYIDIDSIDYMIDKIEGSIKKNSPDNSTDSKENKKYNQKDSMRNSENINKTSKKLYRDTSNQKLAGVASGLAHYLNVDVLLVRLGLVFAFFMGFGSPFLAYLIAWAIIPSAKTEQEKAAMIGE